MAETDSSISLTPTERAEVQRIVGKWLKLIRNAHSATSRDHLNSALLETFALARATASDKDTIADQAIMQIALLVADSDARWRVRADGKAILRAALDRVLPTAREEAS